MTVANVTTTQNLLAALPRPPSHIVFASTLDVYGVPEWLPLTEDHPTNPVTAYGEAKLLAERTLEDYCRKHDKKLTILRLSHVYGPSEPQIKAIPIFIANVSSERTPTIFGDGSELRDYVYVADVARAFLSAIEMKVDGIFNIAGGKSTSLKEVLEIIIRISGKNIRPVYRERLKDHVDFCFDITKARTKLGFTASTPLAHGLKRHSEAYDRRRRGR